MKQLKAILPLTTLTAHVVHGTIIMLSYWAEAYGMVYQITIPYASGKKLHVSGAGSFVAQTPGGKWYSYTSFPQTFDITSDSWLFKFVQPGGNSSNFAFEIS